MISTIPIYTCLGSFALLTDYKSFSLSLSGLIISHKYSLSGCSVSRISCEHFYEYPKSQLAVNVSLFFFSLLFSYYVYQLACLARRGASFSQRSLANDRRAQAADTDPVLDKRAFELFIESVSKTMCKANPHPHTHTHTLRLLIPCLNPLSRSPIAIANAIANAIEC